MFTNTSYSKEISHFIEEKALPVKSTSAVHAVGGKRHSAGKADKYFSELTKSQVLKLYEIYKFDFQLFGYDHQSYIDLAKHEEEAKKKDVFDLAFDELKLQQKDDVENNIIKENQNSFKHKNLGKLMKMKNKKMIQNKKRKEVNLKKNKVKHNHVKKNHK